ncbi:hypothetical protein PPERSA_00195 [Pseudocohnilembus persalinus]|uniref:MYND-type domain-containing protein n=1 Tax=Pseudocohnilembus persalinus TaxID=266149 RepID=A0A0V0QQV9_PSEPJ|nr:hypothetical protein PPERSA_00195 [Pseudocohnilembus persalinus]|eukprot:KRX04426.1 hypothetical protein PPERSA_00195 [Pseudocohnilembus persalinus]
MQKKEKNNQIEKKKSTQNSLWDDWTLFKKNEYTNPQIQLKKQGATFKNDQYGEFTYRPSSNSPPSMQEFYESVINGIIRRYQMGLYQGEYQYYLELQTCLHEFIRMLNFKSEILVEVFQTITNINLSKESQPNIVVPCNSCHMYIFINYHCKNCFSAFYCDKTCQKNHQAKHEETQCKKLTKLTPSISYPLQVEIHCGGDLGENVEIYYQHEKRISLKYSGDNFINGIYKILQKNRQKIKDQYNLKKKKDWPMNCRNNQHYEQQYIFFKFSEKIDEILQCMSCSLKDPQNDKKIIIDQILKFPSSKIENFPPLKDQKNYQKIQNIMENFTKEKIKEFKEYVNTQINNYYQKINKDLTQVLNQSKKDILQQFENILEFTNVSEFYDIAPVKEMIEKYQKNNINLNELFQQQLQMKKSFEDEKKFNIAISQEKIQNEVKNLVENFQLQLDEKVEIFKEKIIVNTEVIEKYKRKIENDQYEIPQKNSGNQLQIQFFKQNKPYNPKQEIEILNNSRRIKIDNKTNEQHKQLYSEGLEKNRRYHFKMKINFHQEKQQLLAFFLLGSNDKDNVWGDQNYILINNFNGDCGAGNGEREIKEGQRFLDFWEDDVSILNVVFNYQEKLFEVYDDQRKGALVINEYDF